MVNRPAAFRRGQLNTAPNYVWGSLRGAGAHCCGSIPQSRLEDGTTSLKTQFELEYWPAAADTQYYGCIAQKPNTLRILKPKYLES